MSNQKKKLFIDLTGLARTITGIENYALNISKAILKSCKDDVVCYLLFRKFIHPEFLEFKDRHILKISPFDSQILTEQLYIPFYIKTNRFDYCIFACFPPGLLVRKRIISVCYDAAMWKYKETLSLKNKIYFRPLTELALKKADKILTISNSSEIEIGHYFPSLKDKITNISAALPGSFSEIKFADYDRIVEKFGIKKKYIISVGSLEPRKNLKFLIQNIAPLLIEADINLVIVGRKAWGSSDIETLINTLKVGNRIILTGYVSTTELQSLYQFSECFVFPSLYEGFGFPILEAFSCGCPVIASNCSSIPEVAGNAAILINPLDGNELIEKIKLIVNNPAYKENFRIKGYEQLKKFSWQKCAEKFWLIYDKTHKIIL